MKMANGTATTPDPVAKASAAAKASASAKAKAAAAALKVLTQRSHQNSAKYFAYGIAGIIGVFIILNWSRFFYKRYASGSKFSKVQAVITRPFRKFLVRKVPGFTSGGHALVFLAYLAVSLSVLFTNVLVWSDTKQFAKRLGWLSACNICLVVFLALKNTPLGFLTAYSHERLNSLHQVAGYSTIAYTLTHGVVYVHAWFKQHHLDEFSLMVQRMGYTAAFCMMLLFATTFILRKKQYELFHILHVLLAVVIITTAALHRPKYTTKSVIILITAGGIWGADRVFRMLKVSLFAIGNKATITPLPHGGTRIVLKKSLPFATAGSHCLLYLPAIRKFEGHPFTVVSTSPLQFVVASYDGFTKDLHDYASRNPGKSLTASLDGPYGNAPDLASFDRVIFIAGGSGASFTFGVVVALLRKLGDSKKTTITFTWAVRDQDQLAWFSEQLQEIASSPLVTLDLHSTSPTSTPSITSEPKQTSSTPSETDFDTEKQPPMTNHCPLNSSFSTQHGRPSVTNIITLAVAGADNKDRIAVVTCGPDGMMLEARKAVATNIKVKGPALELFAEQFGW